MGALPGGRAGREEPGTDALVLYGLLLPPQKREQSYETETPAPLRMLQVPHCKRTPLPKQVSKFAPTTAQHHALQGNGTRDRSRKREKTLHMGHRGAAKPHSQHRPPNCPATKGEKRRAGGSRQPLPAGGHGSARLRTDCRAATAPGGREPRERGNPSQ